MRITAFPTHFGRKNDPCDSVVTILNAKNGQRDFFERVSGQLTAIFHLATLRGMGKPKRSESAIPTRGRESKGVVAAVPTASAKPSARVHKRGRFRGCRRDGGYYTFRFSPSRWDGAFASLRLPHAAQCSEVEDCRQLAGDPFKKVALSIFGVQNCNHGITRIVFPAKVGWKCGDSHHQGGNPGRAFSMLQKKLGDERGADAPRLNQ